MSGADRLEHADRADLVEARVALEPGVVDQLEAYLAGKPEPRRLVAGEFDLAFRQRDADDVDAVMARRAASTGTTGRPEAQRA
jgi:hypothetical protein